ncbi:uncharacterized protein LOC141590418 [Silene latifolia]|uniref:uncharacterized protein LOC141590418 n=1 Tax=Silene latifolia TaxID=37657 RepID=UPI003D76CCE8
MVNCGFWNIRGMNNVDKQNEIKWFLNQNKVGLFGLLETKIRSNTWLKVKNNICEHWSICTNSSMHKGGRIWVIWDPTSFWVDIQDITSQCIHVKVFDKGRRSNFWMTVVYGMNKAAERDPLWQKLRLYCKTCQGPWVVFGDFNAIMAPIERIGGADVSNADIQPMSQMVKDCELHELKSCGSYYTWNNKHEVDGKIYSKLDRVLHNEE